MARMARVVVPFYPHHVTQRGNRRQRTFFGDVDYKTYLELMSEFCRKAGTRVWAYCLMPNHVHLVMVPSHLDGLRAALGEAHRRYTRAVNFRITCGRNGFTRFRWTRPIYWPRCAMWNRIRWRRGFAGVRRSGRGRVRRHTCADGTMDWWRFSRCCHASTTGRRIYWTPEKTISGDRFPRIPAPADRWVTPCSFIPLNESQIGC